MRTKKNGVPIVHNSRKHIEANREQGNMWREAMSLQTNALLRTLLLRGRNGKAGASGGMSDRRDYEEACGYIEDITFEDYYATYDRVDIATRIVETYPDYTFIQSPEIFEKASATSYTGFEKDWNAFCLDNSPFAELRKLDIVSGIGRFGVMVIGINDGKTLDQPLAPMTATATKKRTIMYHRSFNEGEVKIVEFDTNRASVRYGQPVVYEITPGKNKTEETVRITPLDHKDPDPSKSANPFNTPFRVHYTRTIHFADNALCGNVYGVERLRRVFNRMTDIIKIVGGSAEMFWQGAFSGISFEMDSEAQVSDPDKLRMKQDIDNYINRLQRTLLLQGVKANPLSPTIASPKDHLDVQLTMASIATRIPKRILSGSEMGKLSSTQDAETWDTQIKTRRENQAGPYLVRPYVKFCITNGVVRPPTSGRFTMSWPKLNSVPITDRGRSAEYFTTALDAYCNKGLYFAMPFSDYLVNVWGYDSDYAEQLAEKFDKSSFEKMRKANMEAKNTPTATGTTTTTKKQTTEEKSRTAKT